MCDITSGRNKVCKNGVAGVGVVYLLNWQEDAFTIDEATGKATGINPAITEAFPYYLVGDGNSLSEDKPSDRNTFTSVNTQTIVAITGKMDGESSAQLNLVAHSYPIAVVKDRNGKYWAVGIDDGIDFQVTATTGGAKSDLNGYTLNGVSTTKNLAPELDEATVTALEALVVAPSLPAVV